MVQPSVSPPGPPGVDHLVLMGLRGRFVGTGSMVAIAGGRGVGGPLFLVKKKN